MLFWIRKFLSYICVVEFPFFKLFTRKNAFSWFDLKVQLEFFLVDYPPPPSARCCTGIVNNSGVYEDWIPDNEVEQ